MRKFRRKLPWRNTDYKTSQKLISATCEETATRAQNTFCLCSTSEYYGRIRQTAGTYRQNALFSR